MPIWHGLLSLFSYSLVIVPVQFSYTSLGALGARRCVPPTRQPNTATSLHLSYCTHGSYPDVRDEITVLIALCVQNYHGYFLCRLRGRQGSVRKTPGTAARTRVCQFIGVVWPAKFSNGGQELVILTSTAIADWRIRQNKWPAIAFYLPESARPPALPGSTRN
jgi:hypothetical protein